MSEISILVVDDEKEIADLVEIYLGQYIKYLRRRMPRRGWSFWRRRAFS